MLSRYISLMVFDQLACCRNRHMIRVRRRCERNRSDVRHFDCASLPELDLYFDTVAESVTSLPLQEGAGYTGRAVADRRAGRTVRMYSEKADNAEHADDKAYIVTCQISG